MHRLCGLGLLALVLSTSSLAREQAVNVSDAWIKSPAPGDTTADAFVVVHNPTMYDIYVTAVATDAAEKVAIRRGADTLTAIDVPAFGTLTMDPEGAYLLLSGLKRALKDGEEVTLRLTTDGGLELEAAALVRHP